MLEKLLACVSVLPWAFVLEGIHSNKHGNKSPPHFHKTHLERRSKSFQESNSDTM